MNLRRWSINTRHVIGQPGNPMLERWRLLQTPWFGLYVHHIYREDLDRVPHDHPWVFTSLVLRGGYIEEYRADARVNRNDVRRAHARWSVHRFPLQAAHRIISVLPGTTTLVWVGPKVRTWGFYDGWDWVPWGDYSVQTRLRPTEGVTPPQHEVRP
jgi:hypothetical protein